MNMKKNGRPYSYPDTVIMAIAGIRAIHGPLSYRMCQGMAISALGEEDAPDHVTLWRRIKAMKVLQEGSITTVRNGGDVLCLIPDATGLAPATRSDWIHHKHRKARGFIKLSVMINQETREILAFRVTDERKGDSSQFNALVGRFSWRHSAWIRRTSGQGCWRRNRPRRKVPMSPRQGVAPMVPKDPRRGVQWPRASRDPQNGTACCLSAMQVMPEGSA